MVSPGRRSEGARRPRWLLVAVVLVLTPALAGCNFKQWWDGEGTFRIAVAPEGPTGTALSDFQALRIGVYDVAVRQDGEINPHLFAYNDEPQVVDMVRLGRDGGNVPIVEQVWSLRAVTSITVRIDTIEAIDASGNSLPSCHPGTEVESRPCVSTPLNGAYRIDSLPFSPKRGEVATFLFPLSVQYAAGANEYYIQADPARARISQE